MELAASFHGTVIPMMKATGAALVPDRGGSEWLEVSRCQGSAIGTSSNLLPRGIHRWAQRMMVVKNQRYWRLVGKRSFVRWKATATSSRFAVLEYPNNRASAAKVLCGWLLHSKTFLI